jgi:hypothetical protein
VAESSACTSYSNIPIESRAIHRVLGSQACRNVQKIVHRFSGSLQYVQATCSIRPWISVVYSLKQPHCNRLALMRQWNSNPKSEPDFHLCLGVGTRTPSARQTACGTLPHRESAPKDAMGPEHRCTRVCAAASGIDASMSVGGRLRAVTSSRPGVKKGREGRKIRRGERRLAGETREQRSRKKICLVCEEELV